MACFLGFLCLLAHPPQTCAVVGVLGICRRVRGASGSLARATCLVPKSIRTGASSVRFHRDAERVTKGRVPQPREWRRELARGWPDPHIQPPSLTTPPAVLENREKQEGRVSNHGAPDMEHGTCWSAGSPQQSTHFTDRKTEAE